MNLINDSIAAENKGGVLVASDIIPLLCMVQKAEVCLEVELHNYAQVLGSGAGADGSAFNWTSSGAVVVVPCMY